MTRRGDVISNRATWHTAALSVGIARALFHVLCNGRKRKDLLVMGVDQGIFGENIGLSVADDLVHELCEEDVDPGELNIKMTISQK